MCKWIGAMIKGGESSSVTHSPDIPMQEKSSVEIPGSPTEVKSNNFKGPEKAVEWEEMQYNFSDGLSLEAEQGIYGLLSSCI